MKYLYKNKYWPVNKEYNIYKILYLMVDRPNKTYYGGFVWVNNKNKSHRDYDLPSTVFCYKDRIYNLYWAFNNILHRKYKPAVVENNCIKYYVNGKLVRKQGKQNDD